MPDDEATAEIERLERMLAASQGLPGYAERVKAIVERLTELKADKDDDDAG